MLSRRLLLRLIALPSCASSARRGRCRSTAHRPQDASLPAARPAASAVGGTHAADASSSGNGRADGADVDDTSDATAHLPPASSFSPPPGHLPSPPPPPPPPSPVQQPGGGGGGSWGAGGGTGTGKEWRSRRSSASRGRSSLPFVRMPSTAAACAAPRATPQLPTASPPSPRRPSTTARPACASTASFVDLVEERKAAVRAVLDVDHDIAPDGVVTAADRAVLKRVLATDAALHALLAARAPLSYEDLCLQYFAAHEADLQLLGEM